MPTKLAVSYVTTSIIASVARTLGAATRQYGRLVDEWVALIGLDPAGYGTHGLRRTKVFLSILNSPEFRRRVGAFGIIVAPMNGPAFADYIKSEREKWARVTAEKNARSRKLITLLDEAPKENQGGDASVRVPGKRLLSGALRSLLLAHARR